MISIVDYGAGNLRSVAGALSYLGIAHRFVATPSEIVASERLLLPGVGSFRAAMERIRGLELDAALDAAVHGEGVPILGICLGMQLFADVGDEDGETPGLGWIPGRVRRLAAPGLKVPHIGFNEVRFGAAAGTIADGFEGGTDFYFVHAYHFDCLDGAAVAARTDYGAPFVSAVRRDRIYGTQFHPEKSQSNGLRLLRSFARASERVAAC